MDMTPAREYIGRSCSPTENAEEAARHDVTRKVFMSDHRRNLAPAEEKRVLLGVMRLPWVGQVGKPKDVRDVFCIKFSQVWTHTDDTDAAVDAAARRRITTIAAAPATSAARAALQHRCRGAGARSRPLCGSAD